MTENELEAAQRMVNALSDLLDNVVEHVAIPEGAVLIVEEAEAALDEGRRMFSGPAR